MASNREKIVSYIQGKGQATVAERLGVLDIERAMIHRHLKQLVESGAVRDRDTMTQERVKIEELDTYVRERLR